MSPIQSNKTSKSSLIGLVVLALTAFCLLSYNLAENPPGLFCDEAVIGIDAYSIATTGHDHQNEYFPLWFKGIGSGSAIPGLLTYSTVPFVAIMDLTIFATRFSSVMWGVLLVVAVFLLTKELFSSSLTGLFGAIFLICSPWFLHNYRIAQTFNTLPPLVVLALYFLIRGAKEYNFKLYLLGLLTTVLSLHSYPSVLISFPPVLIVFGLLFFRPVLLTRKYFFTTLLFAALGCFSIWYVLSKPGAMRRFEQRALSDRISIESYQSGLKKSFSKEFLFETGSRHERDGAVTSPDEKWGVYPYYFMPLIFLAVLDFIFFFRREKILLIVWLLTYPLGGFGEALETWLVFGLPLFPILAAGGLGFLLKLSSYILPSKWYLIGAPISLAMLVFATINLKEYLYQYHYKYIDSAVNPWQYGPGKVIEKFTAIKDQYDELVLTHHGINAPDYLVRFFASKEVEKKIKIAVLDGYDATKRQLFAMRSNYINNIPSIAPIKIIDTVPHPRVDPYPFFPFYLFEVKPTFFGPKLENAEMLGLIDYESAKKDSIVSQIDKGPLPPDFTKEFNNIKWKNVGFTSAEENPFKNYLTLNNDIFQVSFGRKRGCGYSFFYIHSPIEQEVYFRFSTPGETLVRIGNNSPLNYPNDRSYYYDQHSIRTSLSNGSTPVLIKICNPNDSDWEFHLRVTDKNGTAMTNIVMNSTAHVQ